MKKTNKEKKKLAQFKYELNFFLKEHKIEVKKIQFSRFIEFAGLRNGEAEFTYIRKKELYYPSDEFINNLKEKLK
jgi:hypothetical protein